MRINLIRLILLGLAMLTASAASSAQVSISVNFGPPALPVYQQPACPGDDYIWTPGYWAWDPDAGYYWVPGTWVLAPEPGLLWTPGYWAFDNGLYYFHAGYWGPTVGYYGGIDYGFGYTGAGYYGGYWKDRHFFYNRAVTNVDVVHIHNVYRAAAPPAPAASRVSFNGGPGGTRARPTAEQETAARERRAAPTSAQLQHERAASKNRQLFASANAGRPPVAATAKSGAFSGKGVVAASRAGAPYHPPAKPAAPPTRGATSPTPTARPEKNPARPGAEPGRTPAQPSAAAREKAPPRPEKQVRPENAPRTQAAPPPSATKRETAPPAERAPQPEKQVRPENRAQATPPPKREAAPARERAPQARPEKAPPAPKAEARPAAPKAPPKEEEHPKQEPPR